MRITVLRGDKSEFNNVEIREPVMQDVINAERITGRTDGVEFQLALLSQCGTFDGRTLPPEDLRGLSMKDFLSISTELLGTDMRDLLKELLGQQSTLPEKPQPASKE